MNERGASLFADLKAPVDEQGMSRVRTTLRMCYFLGAAVGVALLIGILTIRESSYVKPRETESGRKRSLCNGRS